MKRPDNISSCDWKLLQSKYSNMENVIKKIKQNYPIQYLIGYVDFFDNKIEVNKNVLIPRFETETLVEKTLSYIEKLKLKKSSVLEIGTGSGCISIALKNEIDSLEITAMDISSEALKLAKKNAKSNKVKINFIIKNLFKFNLLNKYDILISNPPYIKMGEKIDPKTDYEPKIALYADETGNNFYEKIFEVALKCLNPKHLITLEIEETQGKELKSMAKKYFPTDKIVIEKDLPGKDRFLFIYSE